MEHKIELAQESLGDRLNAIERSLQELSGQVRRVVLNQDELRDRLSTAERTVHQLVAMLQAQQPPAPTGLEIGTAAPDFALPDLKGNRRHLRDFLGQPLLVIFYSTTCIHCKNMAPRLGTELPADGPRVLLISRAGDRKEHRRLAKENNWWRCDVVIEPDNTAMNAYMVNGTPGGYLLDAEGRIASPLTLGADALLALATSPQPAAAAPAQPAAEQSDPEKAAEPLTAESLRAKQEAATERARAAGLAAGTSKSRIKRDGLAAGTPAPDFTLPDLRGMQRSLVEFRGNRVLLIFSDTECGPCQALAPSLVELHQQHRADGLEVVMVSRGGALANRAKARQHGFTFPVLLQKQWEVSKEYAIFATPVAYLVDAQGVIEKDVAIGSEAILGLV